MLGYREICGRLKRLMLAPHTHPSCLAIPLSKFRRTTKAQKGIGYVPCEVTSEATTFRVRQHWTNAFVAANA